MISLQFNPYFLEENEEKKKAYEEQVREILEQREKVKQVVPKMTKEKIENASLRKAWLTIAKKDIPKAYRIYQKFKADQEASNKKLS